MRFSLVCITMLSGEGSREISGETWRDVTWLLSPAYLLYVCAGHQQGLLAPGQDSLQHSLWDADRPARPRALRHRQAARGCCTQVRQRVRARDSTCNTVHALQQMRFTFPASTCNFMLFLCSFFFFLSFFALSRWARVRVCVCTHVVMCVWVIGLCVGRERVRQRERSKQVNIFNCLSQAQSRQLYHHWHAQPPSEKPGEARLSGQRDIPSRPKQQ